MGIQNQLASVRAARGMAAAELARAAGVSRQTIHAVEAGAFVPNTAVALRLAAALQVSVEELFALDAQAPVATVLKSAIAIDARVLRARQPVQLCQVGRRTVAVPVEPSLLHLPEAQGVVASGRRGVKIAVELLEEWRPEEQLLVAGCDPAVTTVARHLRRSGIELVPWPCNSSQALDLLKRGDVHAAGCHLSDGHTGASNLPAIHSRFRPADVAVVTFAVWEVGLVVRHGNPLGVHGIADLARPGASIVNREAGSGSRALLDAQLRKAGLKARQIAGYATLASGHLAAARAVAAGNADACVATRAVASAFQLHFIPLAEERYDFALVRRSLRQPAVQAFLDTLNRAALRRELAVLGGYDTAQTGRVVA